VEALHDLGDEKLIRNGIGKKLATPRGTFQGTATLIRPNREPPSASLAVLCDVSFSTLNHDARHIFSLRSALEIKAYFESYGKEGKSTGLRTSNSRSFPHICTAHAVRIRRRQKKPRRDTTKRHKWGAARSPICVCEGGLPSWIHSEEVDSVAVEGKTP